MSEVSITSFEFFRPKLFLEIFRYFNGSDIYKAFYGINHRLTTLVLNYGMKYLDLSEVKVSESRKILSDINCSEINILILSSKYNDEQIDQILDRNYFPLSKFEYLYSLTLDSIGLFTFDSIINQKFDLDHLQSLIIRFRSDLCEEKLVFMYQFILYQFSFRFKSLKLLDLSVLNINYYENNLALESFTKPIKENSSLKYLSIKNVCYMHIGTLLSHFPNLSKLNAAVELNALNLNYPLLSNLISCKLKIRFNQFESILSFIKQCPALKKLLINIDSIDDSDFDHINDLPEDYFLQLQQSSINIILKYISLDINEDLVERTISIIDGKLIIEGEDSEPEIVNEFEI